jgi:uroporphyrinogen-III synthase
MNSIFISKSEDEVGPLVDFCMQHSIALTASAGIEIEMCTFDEPLNYDILFFGSKNSVAAYFKQYQLRDKIKIACVGTATSDALLKFGHSADFIAKNTTDSSIKLFSDWVKYALVFFPSSDKTLKTFGKFLEQKQQLFAIAYCTKNIPFSQNVCTAEIHIFTSPSNVCSFAQTFPLQKLNTVIAWGESTEKAIKEQIEFVQLETLEFPTIENLIIVLKAME